VRNLKGIVVTINAIFLIWAGFLIFRDRQDWFKYVIVILAAMFLASTGAGTAVTDAVGDLLGWVDDLLSDGIEKLGKLLK
jgi:hypothetical protein